MYLYLNSEKITKLDTYSFQMKLKIENLREFNLKNYSTTDSGNTSYTV